MRTELSLSSLAEFDFGKAEIAFRKTLQSVVRDVKDRGHDGRARKVVLTVILDPIIEGGDVADANVHFTIQAKLPALSTAPRPVMIDRQARLVFNPDSPDNPEQSTLDEGKGK